MLELPWPYAGLSPNARVFWRKKADAAKKYKGDCKILASSLKAPPIIDGFMRFTITFHPPSKRRMDDDNCIGAFKAGRDGLALAWGVDDSIFRPEYRMGEIVKFGAVRVSL